MKNTIITLTLAILFTTVHSQNVNYASLATTDSFKTENKRAIVRNELRFEIRPAYTRPIKKEKLTGIKSLSNMVEDYPSNWLTDYVSSEISIISNGRPMKAKSANEILSAEQKSILSAVDLGSNINIAVKYRTKNSATDNVEIRTMNFTLTVVPEKEAEFIGGTPESRKYLKENIINKLSDKIIPSLQEQLVRFTINEEGQVTNVKIMVPSNDNETDQLIIDAIYNMPKWKPAQNSNGIKVKQDFEFIVGGYDGC